MVSEPKKHDLGLYEEMLGFYITALGCALKGQRGAAADTGKRRR